MSLHLSRQIAPYASHSHLSRGRLHDEPLSLHRSPFQRDRDRIMHTNAFRRMKYKTQVFISVDGDHYRTRLTHSLEVSQIARTLSRSLALDEDLTESLALAHDLGHPPFGHAGEHVLNARMADHGGFDHNAQTIRVLTELEHNYPDFNGLNLSWEVLEGLAKRNGPVYDPPWALYHYQKQHDLELRSKSSLECQVAAIADDIAYNTHDLDDGLRSGLISVEQCNEIYILSLIWDQLTNYYKNTDPIRLRRSWIRELIGLFIRDCLTHSQKLLEQENLRDVGDVRASDLNFIGFSPEMKEHLTSIQLFLRQKLYQHHRVQEATETAQTVLAELFDYLADQPEWEDRRKLADYIAGMTDRFVLRQYKELIGPLPKKLSDPDF